MGQKTAARESLFGESQRGSHAMAAIAWGAFFGALMTIVDYFPQILARTAPGDLPLTALNLAGWLSFEGFFVGFSDGRVVSKYFTMPNF